MGNLFAKKTPKSRVTEQDKAVLQLKTQRDKLKQYQKKIQLNLEKERELAKKLLKDGKKDRALLLLKKKRAQESLLAKTVSVELGITDRRGAELARVSSKRLLLKRIAYATYRKHRETCGGVCKGLERLTLLSSEICSLKPKNDLSTGGFYIMIFIPEHFHPKKAFVFTSNSLMRDY